MRKILKFNIPVLLLALTLLLGSCLPFWESEAGTTEGGTGNIPTHEVTSGRWTSDADKIAVFASGAPKGTVGDGLLTLTLSKEDSGYVGAEYRTQARYSYGYYSVSMKAASCPGVISSFFTYTNWPWDEIDIEFLGDDTTRVQFNYFKNGVGGHEYVYYLGFDASEGFHEYGFDWQPDSITWYVDGQSVYQATADIPSTAGQIMMNLWNVDDSNADWAGKFDDSLLPVIAQYQWVGYKRAE